MLQSTIRLNKPAAWQPAAEEDDRRLPAKWTNHRFVYVHYPFGWVFDADYGFVPTLNQLTAKPGVNGVGADGKLNRVITSAGLKGGVVIDPSDGRLGKWRNHIASYPTQSGGKHYCFAPVRYDILPGGHVSPRPAGAAFAEFCAYLRDNNLVAPMEDAVYRLLLEREQDSYLQTAQRAGASPHLAPAAEACRLRVEAMRAAWAAPMEAGVGIEATPDSMALDDDEVISAPTPTAPQRVRRAKVTA